MLTSFFATALQSHFQEYRLNTQDYDLTYVSQGSNDSLFFLVRYPESLNSSSRITTAMVVNARTKEIIATKSFVENVVAIDELDMTSVLLRMEGERFLAACGSRRWNYYNRTMNDSISLGYYFINQGKSISVYESSSFFYTKTLTNIKKLNLQIFRD